GPLAPAGENCPAARQEAAARTWAAILEATQGIAPRLQGAARRAAVLNCRARPRWRLSLLFSPRDPGPDGEKAESPRARAMTLNPRRLEPGSSSVRLLRESSGLRPWAEEDSCFWCGRIRPLQSSQAQSGRWCCTRRRGNGYEHSFRHRSHV